MSKLYAVIEAYKGMGRIIYTGSKDDCIKFEQLKRKELIELHGADITGIKDYFTESLEERGREQLLKEEYKEFIKDKSKDYLNEIVEFNGAQYSKAVLDFKIAKGELISLVEWAKKNGITSATARQRAGRGAFKTAQKIGRNWVIDKNEKLIDHRKKDS